MSTYVWPPQGGSGGGVTIYVNFAAFVPGTQSGQLAVAADTGILYEWNGSSWIAISGPSIGTMQVFGSRAVPLNITAAGGISFASVASRITAFVQGNGGAIIITANPKIVNTSGSFVGQELTLIFRSDTNTLRINDGNGVDQNGDLIGDSNSAIRYEWDGTNWFELNRRK